MFMSQVEVRLKILPVIIRDVQAILEGQQNFDKRPWDKKPGCVALMFYYFLIFCKKLL